MTVSLERSIFALFLQKIICYSCIYFCLFVCKIGSQPATDFAALGIFASSPCRSSSTIARYVVNFERDGSETKSTADDISTIGSNKVENEKILLSPKEEREISATKLTVTDLQQLVAIALHEDQSLPMDLGTLQFTDGQ